MSEPSPDRVLVTEAALAAALAAIPSGDGVLDPDELAAIADQVAAELEPPIDLTVLYTNAKI